jgi:hypothetical protein
LSIGFTEGTLTGNSPVELRYLNPFIIFHSLFSWRDYDTWGPEEGSMVGSLFSLDLEWAIAPSLAVYGQFVMNEFSTPYELKRWPDTQPPNALGYLAGIEKTFRAGLYGFSAYGEFVYTDPFLYTLSSPYASYIWMRRLSIMTSKDRRYTWMGYPEGRDRIVYAAGVSMLTGNVDFSLDLSYIRRGSHTITWDWGNGKEYNEQKTPSGIVENEFKAVIGAEWEPVKALTFSFYISGRLLTGAGHIAGRTEKGLDIFAGISYTYWGLL